jgi:hypothetical protein
VENTFTEEILTRDHQAKHKPSTPTFADPSRERTPLFARNAELALGYSNHPQVKSTLALAFACDPDELKVKCLMHIPTGVGMWCGVKS